MWGCYSWNTPSKFLKTIKNSYTKKENMGYNKAKGEMYE